MAFPILIEVEITFFSAKMKLVSIRVEAPFTTNLYHPLLVCLEGPIRDSVSWAINS